MLCTPRFRFSAAFVAALLCSATCAQAATVSDYSVQTELAAHYEQHATPPDGTAEFQSTFSISTTYPEVSFSDGALVGPAAGSTTVSNVDSSAYMEVHTPTGTVSASCAGSSTQPIAGPSITSSVLTPLDGGALLTVKPFADVTLLWTCTGPTTFPSALLLPNLPGPDGNGPFDLAFTMPAQASSMGKVIQLVNKDVPTDQCPLRNASTTTCTLHLEGQVTFQRIGQHTEQAAASDDDLLTPLGPKSQVEDLLTPLVKKAKLAGDGNATTFTFTCGAGCTLTARVYGGGGGVRAASAPAPLATKRITLAHGGTRHVTMRFGKKARRAIRRAGGVRLQLVARPLHGGRAVTRTLTLRLPRR
jgi:hypothetical protein